MSSPHVGDIVCTPDHGPGTVEKVFYGIITKLNPRRRFQICTVALSEPYTVKIMGHDRKVERVEAEVRYQRSRTYTSE